MLELRNLRPQLRQLLLFCFKRCNLRLHLLCHSGRVHAHPQCEWPRAGRARERTRNTNGGECRDRLQRQQRDESRRQRAASKLP